MYSTNFSNQIAGSNTITFTSGIAAANAADYTNDYSLMLDWSYDGLYFTYKNIKPIIISLGPKTTKTEIFKIDTPEMKTAFKILSFKILNELPKTGDYHYSEIIRNSYQRLQEIVDGFV